ncbi:hypothetical protein ZOSMA_7G01560 [Zostera marina]|uniref:DUF1664 domain-containing protein n=1 Tax=Zostera marina TaxID=29655 RepID=A0A0K9NQA4_ZOSMR|nr:hypothetical protein ZOSMA_7G01560 [Zostera marina]
MAIPFVKLTVLVGAGVAGSILATDGWLSNVPHFISGAFKFFGKHIQEDKSRSSTAKNTVDDYYLMSQVNSLREQLQSLQSSRPVTIISESYGVSTVTVVIILGTVGSCLWWWKGWKISDMAFVSQGSFNVSRNKIASQIDSVSSSVSSTKRHLSSKIDHVECTLNDCLDLTAAIKEEVSELCGDVSGVSEKYELVYRTCQVLESRIDQYGSNQGITAKGIYALCQSAKKMEDKMAEKTQFLPSSSQRLAIEQKTVAPVSMTENLLPMASASTSDPGTPPTPVESPRVLQSSKTATASNFKDFHGLRTITRSVSMKRNETPQPQDQLVSNSPGTSRSNETQFAWKLPNLKILTRSRSSASHD